MSRFGNLEFDSGRESSYTQEPSVRTEPFFLEQALRAFEDGRFHEALQSYAKALEFNPTSAPAWCGQVRSLIELGEFNEARVWVDKGLATLQNDGELLAAKAVCLARLGDLQGAISFSDAAVESEISTPYIWLARGDVLLARKEKRAEYCFEKAFSLARDNWFVLWLTSRIQAFYEHFAKALKFAQQALNFEPGRAILWVQVGQCQLQLGLVTQAQNSLERARELDPHGSAQQGLNEAAASSFVDRLARRCRQWFQK